VLKAWPCVENVPADDFGYVAITRVCVLSTLGNPCGICSAPWHIPTLVWVTTAPPPFIALSVRDVRKATSNGESKIADL
jgi:hypothetical protein